MLLYKFIQMIIFFTFLKKYSSCCDIEQVDSHGRGALHYAAQAGAVDVSKVRVRPLLYFVTVCVYLSLALPKRFEIINACTFYLQYLIKSGIDVTREDEDGRKAAHLATAAGHFDILSLLNE